MRIPWHKAAPKNARRILCRFSGIENARVGRISDLKGSILYHTTRTSRAVAGSHQKTSKGQSESSARKVSCSKTCAKDREELCQRKLRMMAMHATL